MGALIGLVTGLVAGTHTATWGMFKDAPHEGFTYPKYFRSVLVGGALALVLYPVLGLDLTRIGDLVVFFGAVYAVERGLLEVYKSFIRDEDQSKYFIPMQFHVGGRVVQGRWARRAAGAGYVMLVLLLLAGIHALQRTAPDLPGLLVVLVVGSAGGWIAAFGGAWKDAPIEGFELFKFFRSPLIALGFAIGIAMLTDSYVLIALAGLGYSIATIETYKTFFFPSRPRGKFAGKPVLYPEMLARRKRFVPVYVAIWLVIVAAWTAGLMQQHGGLISAETWLPGSGGAPIGN